LRKKNRQHCLFHIIHLARLRGKKTKLNLTVWWLHGNVAAPPLSRWIHHQSYKGTKPLTHCDSKNNLNLCLVPAYSVLSSHFHLYIFGTPIFLVNRQHPEATGNARFPIWWLSLH
jgi:hypothetical protein